MNRTFDLEVELSRIYRFRYRAANKLGWGEFSDYVTVYAAEVPAKPSEISTSIQDIFVKLTWSEPLPRGASITEYDILIK